MFVKRSSAAIRRKRPSWWTPEGVLLRLQAGEFVMAVCQAAAADMQGAGIDVSIQTLRAEISKWAETSSWGEQLKAALGLWKRNRDQGELVLSKIWHEDFLLAMNVCDGNAERAAQMVGVGYGVVLNVMDARNKHYDAEFAERFKMAEMARVAKLRELQLQTAEGDSKQASGVRQRILETVLPGLHSAPKQQEVKITGKVEHEHDHDHRHMHLHALAPEIARDVVLASQNRVRRINAGRPERELEDGAGPTIDVDMRQHRAETRVLREKVESVLGSRGVAALEGAIEEAMDKAMPIIRDSMDGVGEVPS